MLLENHQQFYHTFFWLYIYQDSIQLKKGLLKLYHTFSELYICQDNTILKEGH